jgi:hypothetical protein
MSVERTYEGESWDGKLQEALERALQRLDADLSEGGVRDAFSSWVVTEISNDYGGFVGFCSVKAKITAKRSPEWGLA